MSFRARAILVAACLTAGFSHGASAQCVGVPDGTPCDDANACTYGDICVAGACSGTPVVCASDACVTRACNGTSSCTVSAPAQNGTLCDDGNACTTGDTCNAGGCAGTMLVDDGLRVAKSGAAASITWNLAPGSTGSDVVRGLVSLLPVSPTGVNETPLARNTAASQVTDAGVPPPGAAFWYLVRGTNGCGPGPWGFESRNGIATVPEITNGGCVPNPAASPRYADNGLTVTDWATCREWEKKDGLPGSPVACSAPAACLDPHGVDNLYAWSASGAAADGGAFTDFLSRLNAARFARHGDWRLPASAGGPGNATGQPAELESIVQAGHGAPAIDPVFGPTAADDVYWSSSTFGGDPGAAWSVAFDGGGSVSGAGKLSGRHVRAVRGGGSTAVDPCAGVVCAASDACHDAGTCDLLTGLCSNPIKANGTICDDGNLCTYGDTCTDGTCGGSPVVCTNDACNTRSCNGGATCTVVPATDGTGCNDGDACTQSDTCQSGSCVGGSPVVCTASDQCHVAGTCNPGTGTCSNPNAANGTTCSDGSACTQSDTCQSGSCVGANPVVCTASDQCHVAGNCNPGTGACSNPAAANGTTCSDGNACTLSDTCQSGVCVAGSAAAFTDIVYRTTGTFAITNTPLGLGNQTFTGLTNNASTPVFTGAGDATPFSRPPPSGGTTFTNGFVRLRFVNDAGGNPVAGTVRLVEWYFPLEFNQTAGASLTANVDHSVGLIASGLTNCGGGDAACTNHVPTIQRPCASNAQGTLSGTTLTWGSCTPVPTMSNSWSFVSARAASGAGCAAGYNAWGNVTCTASCALVPAAGVGDSYQTWNQALSTFTFNGTNVRTATFTMPAMQIPNGTGQSTTLLSITGSSIVGSQCGSTPGTDLTCNLQ